MFVSRKVVSWKPFSKLLYVCLSLGKLVNRKYFPVNEKQFIVNGKYFLVNLSQRKIWLDFHESVFPLAVFVFQKLVSGKSLSKFFCVYLSLEKLINGKYFLLFIYYFIYLLIISFKLSFCPVGKHWLAQLYCGWYRWSSAIFCDRAA